MYIATESPSRHAGIGRFLPARPRHAFAARGCIRRRSANAQMHRHPTSSASPA